MIIDGFVIIPLVDSVFREPPLKKIIYPLALFFCAKSLPVRAPMIENE